MFGHKKKAAAQGADAAKKAGQQSGYISLLALTMMNVTIVAGLGNDVQEAFYGLTSVTYFTIGAIFFFIPTGLVAAEVGNGFNYVMIIAGLTIFTLAMSWGIYWASRKHNWVDPTNKFAPFTWQIEGLKKPGRVKSNVPTEYMSLDQNPMGMPIKHHFDPDEQIDVSKLPDDQDALAALVAARPGAEHQAAKAGLKQVEAQKLANASLSSPAGVAATPAPVPTDQVTAAVRDAAESAAAPAATATATVPKVEVPAAPPEEVKATELPDDARAAAAKAEDEAQKLAVAAAAMRDEAAADRGLAEAREKAKEAKAAAEQAEKAAGLAEKPAPKPAAETPAPAKDAVPAPAKDAAPTTDSAATPAKTDASAPASDATPEAAKPATDGAPAQPEATDAKEGDGTAKSE